MTRKATTVLAVTLTSAGIAQLGDEAPGDAPQFIATEFLGIADDTAFCTTERYVDNRRLPRHEIRQGSGLVLVHRGMITQPALHRPARGAVLDPVAEMMSPEETMRRLDEIKSIIEKSADYMPEHASFIAENCAA